MAYTAYTGGNTDLDKEIEKQSAKYAEARASGNVQGMIDANETANKARNQYGYAAEYAGDDIANVAKSTGYGTTPTSASAVSSAGGGTSANPYINDLYESKKAIARAALNSAYQSNVATLDKEKTQIAPTYQNAKNQAAATSEVNARNFNEFATAAGLNTGASGQAALARGNVLQGSLTKLNTAEADALSENDRQKALLTTQYENAVAQANATGDYELANALYNEYTRQVSANASMANAQAERENAWNLARFNDSNDWRNLQAQLQNQKELAALNNAADLERAQLSAAKASASGSSKEGKEYTLADIQPDPTYSTAVVEMSDAGVPQTEASGVMTRAEWTRHKNAGSKVAATAYPTYEDYLANYVTGISAYYGG